MNVKIEIEGEILETDDDLKRLLESRGLASRENLVKLGIESPNERYHLVNFQAVHLFESILRSGYDYRHDKETGERIYSEKAMPTVSIRVGYK